MKKLFVFFSVLLFGLSACTPKEDHIKPLSEQETSKLINTYYQQPDSEKLLRALAYFDESSKLTKDKTVIAPLQGLLAGLAVENRPEWKMITQEVVWEKNMIPLMQDMPNRIVLLRRMLANNDTAVTDAAALDFLWGAFAATGNPTFIQVIIRTKNRPAIDKIVRAAAAWSLYSQSTRHPIVVAELKNAPTAPDEFMQQLEKTFQEKK